MKAVLPFFMADDSENENRWKSRLEQGLCLKILPKKTKTTMGRGMNNRKLYNYKTKASREEHVASQVHVMRTLFQHHNTGMGVGYKGKKVRDMCSGINALFAKDRNEEVLGVGVEEDRRSSALYSVIHVRYFEGHGKGMLAKTAARTGCDPAAALQMAPEYVKSILAPLGMLGHPIVIISDNQRGSKTIIKRLRGDPEIGPMLRSVPTTNGARWLGGDITLAVMVRAYSCNSAFPPR